MTSPPNDPAPSPVGPLLPRILIVDDLPVNRRLLVELLDSNKYDLVEAAGGREALALAAEKPPDLVLLDVMMPGMDGFEVCRRLRADPTLREVPIVMLTALDDQASRIAGLEAGADDFSTKPFHRLELIARVRGIMRLNRYRRMAEAQEQIRNQARWLDEARDAIIVRDLDDRISYWNDGATRLFGWTREEAQGRRCAELFFNEKAPFDPAPFLAAREAGHWQGEIHKTTKGGRDIIVGSLLTLLRDSRGVPNGILSIDTDITEKKNAEKLMLRTQRLESIGTLASGVAHDLNNALAPILMSVSMLRMQYPDDNHLFDIVESSAKRGADMVRQLLTFAKGVEGERMLIQPQRLLKEMQKMIKGSFPKNIELEIHFPGNLHTILGDATQLHQVLLNLCVNARDAMPEGGTLVMTAENTSIDAGQAETAHDAKPGRYVIWSIRDTGTGIPQEIIDRIFEPFFTTKAMDKGTGLGLSTVLGIVKSHGGFVRVSSVVGQGSTFAVYLPASEAAAQDVAPAPEEASAFRANGECILVVDDEPPIREIIRRVLESANFRVITAADGTDALVKVADNHEVLRAVITDYHMPNVDGLNFVRVLKHVLPQAKIIVTSGRMDDRVAGEFDSLGINARLDKPFTQAKLIETLRAAFES